MIYIFVNDLICWDIYICIYSIRNSILQMENIWKQGYSYDYDYNHNLIFPQQKYSMHTIHLHPYPLFNLDQIGPKVSYFEVNLDQKVVLFWGQIDQKMKFQSYESILPPMQPPLTWAPIPWLISSVHKTCLKCSQYSTPPPTIAQCTRHRIPV